MIFSIVKSYKIVNNCIWTVSLHSTQIFTAFRTGSGAFSSGFLKSPTLSRFLLPPRPPLLPRPPRPPLPRRLFPLLLRWSFCSDIFSEKSRLSSQNHFSKISKRIKKVSEERRNRSEHARLLASVKIGSPRNWAAFCAFLREIKWIRFLNRLEKFVKKTSKKKYEDQLVKMILILS